MGLFFFVFLFGFSSGPGLQKPREKKRQQIAQEILLEPMLADGFHMQTEPEEYDEFKYIQCTMYCLGLVWINPD